jgi:glutamate 5-kinase
MSEVFQHVRADKGDVGRGMRAKLQAVDFALSHGISAFILDGRRPGQIAAAMAGHDVGTQFRLAGRPGSRFDLGRGRERSSRRHCQEHFYRTRPPKGFLH